MQHDALANRLANSIIRGKPGVDIVMAAERLGEHLGVNLRTDEDRAMWKLLQNDRAMMDWIAVPNFLAAYR